ncbi:MAG: response regulator [Lachnospiraceae bacterium]|nr:response regulator [Lachnospiraceae bacterium]
MGLIATSMDVITAITISYSHLVPAQLNTVLNTLYFVSVAMLGYRLMYYDLLFIYRNEKKSSFIRFNQCLLVIYFLILIFNMFSGYFFSFNQEGEYVKGTTFLAVYIAPAYFVICSAVILISHFRRFSTWQRVAIFSFVFLQLSGMVLQMFFFPDTLLALFMSVLGLMMMLFTMETPDYQKLTITIEELSKTKKVAEEAKAEAEKAREIAQQANRAKSDFLANMSHEIRTPINAVLGMDEMIIRECDDPKIVEYAADIKRAGGMLLSLVNDILDFSKIESGKMDILSVDYDLGILLAETIDMIRSKAQEKNLELYLDIQPDTPAHLCGDEMRIRQIIINILNNAVKYTKQGSVTLVVSGKKLSPEMVQLYVCVRDTGIGIKEEDIGRLFDSFQRVEESRNRNIEGTGLGLSITMRLLNLMGSKLEVKSTYGKGSEFYFYLEQNQTDDRVIGENLQKYYQNEKSFLGVTGESFYAPDAKILVVDDNEMNLKVFLGLLKNSGMQIDTATSGKECLALMEKKAYHIIFMDHQMPEMDGVETLKQSALMQNNLSKDAVMIILTANAVSGAREMFLQEGFQDYLSKPIDVSKLEAMILKYLPKELIDKGTSVKEHSADTVKSAAGKRMEAYYVDWEKGRNRCMNDEEFYREILGMMIESESDLELEQYFEESDFNNYRIKVHAIKSNLANIGAMEVSDMAKQLELAIKIDHNVAYVQEHHAEFIAVLRQVFDEIKEYLSATDS